jgi:hypothetical protein
MGTFPYFVQAFDAFNLISKDAKDKNLSTTPPVHGKLGELL